MTYLKLLECEAFKKDFLDFCYNETLCMQEFDEFDFEMFDEDLFDKLVKFFNEEFAVKITTIHNYPLSYIVKIYNSTYEHFDNLLLLINTIEKLYGHEYD